MNDNLYSKRAELTQTLRSMLDKWEASNNISTNEFDAKANAEHRERCAKIEADLDRVEAQIASTATRSRLDASDNRTVYNTDGKAMGNAGDAKEAWGRKFATAIRSGSSGEINALIAMNFDGTPSSNRAMTVGAAGGVAAVPNNWDEVIRQKLQMSNVIRGISKVNVIDGQKKITIESALPVTELVAEGAAMASPADPTFGSLIQVFPYRFQTKAVLSNEFLDDALSGNGGVGGVFDYVAGKIALSMGAAHENYFCNGTNSSQPQGMGTSQFTIALAAASSTNVVYLAAGTTALTAITADNLVDAYFACKAQYRNNGSWVMSDSLLKTVRKLKTAASGLEYLFKVDATGDLREGVSGLLLGRPLFVSPSYNVTAAVSKPFTTFGDFGNYFEIFDRSSMSVLVDPYSGASTATTSIYATTRMDSKVTQLEAFSVIADAAS